MSFFADYQQNHPEPRHQVPSPRHDLPISSQRSDIVSKNNTTAPIVSLLAQCAARRLFSIASSSVVGIRGPDGIRGHATPVPSSRQYSRRFIHLTSLKLRCTAMMFSKLCLCQLCTLHRTFWMMLTRKVDSEGSPRCCRFKPERIQRDSAVRWPLGLIIDASGYN